MKKVRPEVDGKLEFVQVGDFSDGGDFAEAVKGIDAVIHVVSVCSSTLEAE